VNARLDLPFAWAHRRVGIADMSAITGMSLLGRTADISMHAKTISTSAISRRKRRSVSSDGPPLSRPEMRRLAVKKSLAFHLLETRMMLVKTGDRR
jgi:hypothetical protein